MTDPDAWKKNVTDIVGKKNQETDDAAKRKLARQDHRREEYPKALDLLRAEPEAAFREFTDYLQAQGEAAAVRHEWEDAAGPWIGVAISDKRGLIADVRLQARIGDGETKWVWVYEYGGNRRVSRELEIQRSAAGPSRQYVIETLANHYKEASANRR